MYYGSLCGKAGSTGSTVLHVLVGGLKACGGIKRLNRGFQGSWRALLLVRSRFTTLAAPVRGLVAEPKVAYRLSGVLTNLWDIGCYHL